MKMDLVNFPDTSHILEVKNDQMHNVVRSIEQIPNSVLERLMEEVKNDKVNDMFAYDRAHNRHNRGR